MANRTQVAGRLASLPAPIVTAVTPGYNGPGVPISYEQANGFQEAICRPLEDGGVVLDKDDYDQFRDLLSGVHGILSEVRSTIKTVAVTTYARCVAIAAKTGLVSANYSAIIAGESQSVSDIRSAAIAGISQVVSKSESAAVAGANLTVAGTRSLVAAGLNLNLSGDHSVLLSSRNAELVDDNVAALGFSAVALVPGATNQNLTHYFDPANDETRLGGILKVGCNANTGAGTQIKLDGATGNVLNLGGHHCKEYVNPITLNVDWNSAAETHTTTAGYTLQDYCVNRINLNIKNSDLAAQTIAQGNSILVPLTLNGLTVVGGYAYVGTSDAAASLKQTRWSVGGYQSAGPEDHIAITQIGTTGGVVGASDADSTNLVVILSVVERVLLIS